MKNRIVFFVLAAVFLAAVVAPLSAQRRTGTAAASELLIPVGARDVAMGGSSIATAIGVEALHNNPAGLGRMHSSAEAMVSSQSYIADIGVSYGGVAASFGEFGVIGLTLRSLSFGDIPYTSQEDPENRVGRFFSPNFVTVGLSYSRALTDAISAGGTVKVVSEQIEAVSGSATAFDFGIQYRKLVGITGLNLGVAVKNIGSQLGFSGSGLFHTADPVDGDRPSQRFSSIAASFELPSIIEVGASYEGTVSDNMSWNLNGSFTNNNLYVDEYKLGGEFGMTMESLRLFGRAGLYTAPQVTASSDNIWGTSFGFGVGYAATGLDITVDYGYRSSQYFTGVNVFAVKLGF